MGKRVLGLSLLLVCATGVALAQVVTVATPVYAQLTPMWCWAASGQMTMGFLGTNVSQCDQANKELGRTDCCVASGQLPPTPCIHGGSPQYAGWGFSNDKTAAGTPLTMAQMMEQIALGKPWAFVWKWTSGGGHVMVGTGYANLPLVPTPVELVLINNPEPWSDSGDGGSQYWITYDNYVSGKNHTHGVDFYNITKVSQ
jgi:hypothetical protein